MIAVLGSIGLRIVCRSEHAIEPGDTAKGTIDVEPGGRAAGIAVASRRLGSSVAVFGVIGSDPWAQEAMSALRQDGVEVRAVTSFDRRTFLSTLMIDAKTRTWRAVEDAAASQVIRSEDVDYAALGKASVIVVCSDLSEDIVTRIRQSPQRSQQVVIYTITSACCFERAGTLSHADLVILNATAFSDLVKRVHPAGQGDFTGEQIHLLPDARLHELCRAVIQKPLILTLGARGCFVSDAHGFKMVSAVTGVDIQCTAGAGEAFAGAVASWIDQNPVDLRSAGIYGNAAAALASTRPGVTQSLPSKEEVEQLLRRNR